MFGIHFGSGTLGWHAIWMLVDGVVTLVLGGGMRTLAPASLDLVQYLVGISFISSGISRLLLGFAIRVIEPEASSAKQQFLQ